MQPDVTQLGAIAAIGGARGKDRLALMARFSAAGLALPSLIHPTAWCAPTAEIGRNCHLLAQSVVAAGAVLGDAVIVNTAASVDHECHVEDGVHIAPGARACGEVIIGEAAFVAAGATILPRCSIGEKAVVAAGATVINNVPAGETVYGTPAKPRYIQDATKSSE